MPFAQEQRAPLRERQHGEGRGEIARVARPVGARPRLGQGLDICARLPARPSRAVPRPRAADVLGDRVQPRGLVLRHDAAIETAEGIDEGLLQRVLGVGPAGEPAAAGAFNALRKSGKEKGVTIVSIDGGCEGVRNVASGMIAATFLNDRSELEMIRRFNGMLERIPKRSKRK